ncbi:hypothetical protein RND71_002583 [Anisodus tanguticus]|uniref:DNA (cytosine-5-)-methyltransferase n=1 Tax=Anisodus tanguticus TaxID=243964 RepID=A0AAE1T3X0_9SOLA|nr:hypothetical protein RND71_002583 [Anisodus tanguticus]
MPSKRKASSTALAKSPESSDSTTVSLNKKLKPDPAVVEPVVASPVECDDEVEESVCDSSIDESSAHNKVRRAVQANEEQECVFSGEPVPEAQAGWQKKIKDFVTKGFKTSVLQLPGEVDAICGGPPCQGISGFNRFRDKLNPLQDPKNKQLEVFMDIVKFLKPRFVLVENVVDLVRFADGFLGRCALSKLVGIDRIYEK